MRFPVGAIVLIMVAGLCFFLWIGFNHAFFGEDMLRENLWEAANKSLDGSQKTIFDDGMTQLGDGFGMIGVFCLGIAILVFVVDVLRKPPGEMY